MTVLKNVNKNKSSKLKPRQLQVFSVDDLFQNITLKTCKQYTNLSRSLIFFHLNGFHSRVEEIINL